MRDETELVHGIPVRWVVDDQRQAGTPTIALWLPYLSGTKDTLVSMLERSADAGFFALSFDPWQHGERGSESAEQLRDRLLGAFRRDMWPVIGQTVLDAMAVFDWVIENQDVDAGGIVAGGYSMGGDISVALAGADHRVARVAALGSTPDWARPGMRDLSGSAAVVDQGAPGAYGEWLYSQLDPITHLENFAHGPAILFEHGGADDHVPGEAAHRFAAALNRSGSTDEHVVVHETEGLGHLASVRNPDAVDRCFDWLTQTS
jgi:dienelactone hydrolase